jgi:hypothetical protein
MKKRTKKNDYTISENKLEIVQNFEQVKTIMKNYTEEETSKRDEISKKLGNI